VIRELIGDEKNALKAARTDLAGITKSSAEWLRPVGVQRDIRSLQGTVATLGVAVDDHTPA
jgi:hypothetical protein